MIDLAKKQGILTGVRRYSVKIFTANLLSVTVCIFFLKKYASQGIMLSPAFFYLILVLAAFATIAAYLLKPINLVQTIFPQQRLLFANIASAALLGLLFLGSIGIQGVLFAVLISLVFTEAQHVIHDRVNR